MFSAATGLCLRGSSLLLLYPKAFCGTESCQQSEQKWKEDHPLKMTINHRHREPDCADGQWSQPVYSKTLAELVSCDYDNDD